MGTASVLRAEVEDIANEIFEHLFRERCRRLRRLHHPARIHAWLVAVAGNYTVDYIRKLNARGYGHVSSCMESPGKYVNTNEGGASPPDGALDRQDRVERLARALSALSAQEHLIVDLFYVQGLKHARIAEVLHLNVNTVSAKLRRARIKLRRLLEEGSHELAC